MRVILLLGILSTPVGMMVAPGGGPSALSAQTEFMMRDFYVKAANGDGTFRCAQWCGLLESCC